MSRLAWMLALVLVWATTVVACSGDDEPDEGAAGDGAGDAPRDGGVDADAGAGGAPNVPSGPADGEMLALTYNVAGLPETLSSSMPERFTPMIGPLLNGYDLVLVQESWLTPDPNPGEPLRVYHELLLEEVEHPHTSEPAEVPWGMDERRPSALLGDGLNRFSEFPFEEVTRVAWDICVDTAADCLALKGFSMARTTLEDGVTVDIYNLHMEAGGSPEDDAARAAGIEQMIEFMATMSDGRAVIVGGDFNLHIDSEPDGTLFEHLLDETGLTDVCTQLGCDEPGSIDKFLYRSSEDVRIDALSWSNDSDVFQSDTGEDLSDHPPIAVRFAWTGR
ncbi:MAG: endonuclease/exonuclease/phosphatase family protein [Myxococcales bacterium]|nr:endonuclease/exonuclease/phosphatase family protein [Myxococcales bacterium]